MADIVERPHAPPKSSDGRPTYLQVINLFEFHGLRAPPTNLRDEIVMALEWSWYGVEAANEITALRARCAELEKALEKICRAVEREPVCGGDLDYPHGHNDWLGWRKKMMRPAAEAARSLLPKKEG